MSYEPLYTLTNRMMNSVADISRLVGQISAFDKLSPNPQLRRISRMKSIHSSLAIEANTLTFEQVTAVLDGKRVLAPPKDIHEVQNAYEAYDALSVMNPYSLNDLLRAHKFMMNDLIKDAGCFRTGNVGVFDGENLIHAGTPAHYVPELMQGLFNWLKTTDVHPLITSCVFHYEFEFIHPFSDGNGRTGRLWHSLLLQNWQNVFAWLPVESLVAQHQQEYYKAFGDSGSSGGDSTIFVEFMLDMIEKTLAEAVAAQKEEAESALNSVADPVSTQQEPSKLSWQVKALLDVLDSEEYSAQELRVRLNLTDKNNFRDEYLNPALEEKLIERTIPEKPNSPKQKDRRVRQ